MPVIDDPMDDVSISDDIDSFRSETGEAVSPSSPKVFQNLASPKNGEVSASFSETVSIGAPFVDCCCSTPTILLLSREITPVNCSSVDAVHSGTASDASFRNILGSFF